MTYNRRSLLELPTGQSYFVLGSTVENIAEMNTVDKSETFDEVVRQAFEEKVAESRSWDWFMEKVIWQHCLQLAMWHTGLVAALSMYAFGLYTDPIKWGTVVWIFVVATYSMIGETAGAHRLWAHKAYKAKLPLRILLMICYSTMGLNPLYYWIKDHRVHHKYSETDADPHNAARGFFFAHCGWLAMKRHPDCVQRGREVDMSDILADGAVMFQKKYEIWMKLLLCFVVPTVVPMVFWDETFLHAAVTQIFIRHTVMLNATWLVNSLAHTWGSRPYNTLINPAENLVVSLATWGEGSHNYHHTFPWDYKASEYPYFKFNLTTLFIDSMAKIGWAYDRRIPSREIIDKVIHRIGHKAGIKASMN